MSVGCPWTLRRQREMNRVSSEKKPCGGSCAPGSTSPRRSETTKLLPSSTLTASCGMVAPLPALSVGFGLRGDPEAAGDPAAPLGADDSAVRVLVGACDGVD